MLTKLITKFLLKSTFDTKKVFKVFKEPKYKMYLGKEYYGVPYTNPYNYNSTIIKVYKKDKLYQRNNTFKLFGFNVSYGYPIAYRKLTLGWKDKYGTPRFEWNAGFYLFFFGLQFVIFLEGCDSSFYSDDYWEQILWFSNYCDYDIDKAKSTWSWGSYKDYDSSDKKSFVSSWSDEYLK